jgi:hypothetical protein
VVPSVGLSQGRVSESVDGVPFYANWYEKAESVSDQSGVYEGTPISVTLGQYNVLAGQLWIAVPLTLLLSPLLFGWYLSL